MPVLVDEEEGIGWNAMPAKVVGFGSNWLAFFEVEGVGWNDELAAAEGVGANKLVEVEGFGTGFMGGKENASDGLAILELALLLWENGLSDVTVDAGPPGGFLGAGGNACEDPVPVAMKRSFFLFLEALG